MGGANSGGTAKTGGSGAAGGTSGGTTGSGGTSGGGATTVTGLPAASAVLASMHSANDWFMNKHPDPGADIVTDKTRSSNLWTRATYYEGLMAALQRGTRRDQEDELPRLRRELGHLAFLGPV